MFKTEDDWCIYKESGGRGRGGGISEKCVNLGTQEIGFIGLIWHYMLRNMFVLLNWHYVQLLIIACQMKNRDIKLYCHFVEGLETFLGG